MRVTLLLLALVLFSCTLERTTPGGEMPQLLNTREAIVELLVTANNDEQIEFLDIYADPQRIPSDDEERLEVADILKGKGFNVVDWSRGNWTDGPRIVSLSLYDGISLCQVDKLYRSIEGLEDRYAVTERIRCKKDAEKD